MLLSPFNSIGTLEAAYCRELRGNHITSLVPQSTHSEGQCSSTCAVPWHPWVFLQRKAASKWLARWLVRERASSLAEPWFRPAPLQERALGGEQTSQTGQGRLESSRTRMRQKAVRECS